MKRYLKEFNIELNGVSDTIEVDEYPSKNFICYFRSDRFKKTFKAEGFGVVFGTNDEFTIEIDEKGLNQAAAVIWKQIKDRLDKPDGTYEQFFPVKPDTAEVA